MAAIGMIDLETTNRVFQMKELTPSAYLEVSISTGTLGFELGAIGSEASVLPLCYAAPHCTDYFLFNQEYDQRVVAELVYGVVRGSRLWSFSSIQVSCITRLD